MTTNRVFGAVLGGAIGTAIMVGLLFLLEVETRSAIPIFEVIARFVGWPGRVSVGFAIFVFAGVIIWPLLFVALEPYLPRGPDPAAKGVVLASLLWVVFVITGRGDIGGPLLVVYAAFTLFAHWAYGFTLGALYGRLSGHP